MSYKSNDLFDFLGVGELVCPAYHELCSKDLVSVPGKCPNTCNFNGDCVNGRCFCFLGYHGHDCSKRERLVPGLVPFMIDVFARFYLLVKSNGYILQDLVLITVVVMGGVFLMDFVNVEMVTLALTAPPVRSLLTSSNFLNVHVCLIIDFTSVGEGNKAFLIRVWKPLLSIRVLEP